MTVTIAAIQMCSGVDPERNVASMRRLVREAAAGGALYVQTPEMTGALQRNRAGLQSILKSEADDLVVAAAAELATELRIFLHVGSTAIALADGRIANRAFLFGPDVRKPAAQEFGFGPRESAKQKYTVYLKPNEALRLRKLQNLRILVLDAAGRPVEGARITVDGGMPEHGHGLPTQPKVEKSLGGGMYDIEGLRFSMGGWWEVKLAIDSPQGEDRVTFNLSL